MKQLFGIKQFAFYSLAALSIGLAVVLFGSPKQVHAASWNPGNIIDDYVFTNENDATVAEIQAALRSQVDSCDTNGTKVSEFSAPASADKNGNGVISRAEYGAYRNNPAPFTCLYQYYENPTNGKNNYGKTTIPTGAKSAANLIVDAGKKYNINPKVLVATLKKESAIMVDDWPFLSQFQYAMGAHCPDGPSGAECDEDYAGFAKQMDESAALFRYYLDNMDQPWWSLKKPGNNHILWNVTNSTYVNGSGNTVPCGGRNVDVESRATAALYTYTPYQPNSAALAAFPAAVSSGSSFDKKCAAYGNRNFWYFYRDLFGSTHSIDKNVRISTNLSITENIVAGDMVTGTFKVKNVNEYPVTIGLLRITGVNPQGDKFFFPEVNDVTIAPGGEYTYSQQRQLFGVGKYRFYITSREEGVWSNDWPVSGWSGLFRDVSRQSGSNPKLTTGLKITPSNPTLGDTVTATFTVTNNADRAFPIDQLVVAGRYKTKGYASFAPAANVSIPAGGTYTYSKTQKLTRPGKYAFWVAAKNDGVWKDDNFVKSASDTTKRSLSLTPVANPKVTTNISFSPSSPRVGQNVTATFNIQNNSDNPFDLGMVILSGSGPKGIYASFNAIDGLTIPANSTYNFTRTRTFSKSGTYKFHIAHKLDGVWRDDYLLPASGVSLSKSLTVRP